MPIGTPTVSVTISGIGTYSTFTNTLDGIMFEYKGKTVEDLAADLKNRTGIDFSEVRDKSALLVVIADYEGF
jgi:hypothetical protein